MCGLFFICLSNCHLSVSMGAFVFGQVDASRTLTLAIGDEHRSQSMRSTTGERRPRKAQLFNFSALARATRARAPPPHGAPASPGGCRSAPFKKNISIFRGPYMLGTTNIFAER